MLNSPLVHHSISHLTHPPPDLTQAHHRSHLTVPFLPHRSPPYFGPEPTPPHSSSKPVDYTIWAPSDPSTYPMHLLPPELQWPPPPPEELAGGEEGWAGQEQGQGQGEEAQHAAGGQQAHSHPMDPHYSEDSQLDGGWGVQEPSGAGNVANGAQAGALAGGRGTGAVNGSRGSPGRANGDQEGGVEGDDQGDALPPPPPPPAAVAPVKAVAGKRVRKAQGGGEKRKKMEYEDFDDL